MTKTTGTLIREWLEYPADAPPNCTADEHNDWANQNNLLANNLYERLTGVKDMPNWYQLEQAIANFYENCKHPPTRLYAWHAYDDILCVVCCECGAILAGGAE